MVKKLYTAHLLGLHVQQVEVEVDYRNGLSHFAIVGLADKAVQEAKERVISAIRSSNAEFIPKRVVINLAPADIPKSGPAFDMALAVALLLATEQIDFDCTGKAFVGELALDGNLRPVSGILPIVAGLQKLGFKEVFVPELNGAEASLVNGIVVRAPGSLTELIAHFQGQEIPVCERDIASAPTQTTHKYDISAVKGQFMAKRALEIAAAGGHNLLFSGVPGSGKTMLLRCLSSILPDMSWEECLEVTQIHSLVGKTSHSTPLIQTRPFRSPHHTTSSVALIGGGTNPRPGEVSLAHLGTLFLDEMPEFSVAALESLRQPLEDGEVTVSRATGSVTFPARFQLVAAMNPCRCGYRGSPDKACVCTESDVARYRKRISGPILDRIDLVVNVPKVSWDDISSKVKSETSSQVRKRVMEARKRQLERFAGVGVYTNSHATAGQLGDSIKLPVEAETLMNTAESKFDMSARSIYRTLKVARTIADLEGSAQIKTQHLSEALSFRNNLN